MNQFKTNYALKRVQQIVNEKINKVKRPEKKEISPAKELSNRERLKLLKAGKVPFKKDLDQVKDYDELRDVFDFSSFEHDTIYNEKKFKEENDKYNKLVEEIKGFGDKIKDEIVLGDEENAMKLLTQFERE